MTADDHVLLDIDSSTGVATITLNRPAAGNAITPAMGTRLIELLKQLNADRDDVRVIILTGSGKFFCTGMDLRGGGPSAATLAAPFAPFEAVWASTKPVVARVNGPALGGGVGFLFACDIRVAVDTAYIAFPEAALGIYPALISGYIAPQLGPYLTQSLMMTGEKFTSQQLLAAGQVSRVATPAELDKTVADIVGRLLTAPKHAHAGVKRIVRLVNYCGAYHDEAMDALVTEFQAMMRSEEARHGLKTFALTKEKPNWSEWYDQKRSSSKEKSAAKSKL